MKTFIFSYIVSMGWLIAVWYSDVMARPFHILPRLAFYMAFPLAVFLCIGLVVLGSMFGLSKIDKQTKSLSEHRPTDIDPFQKSA